MIEDWTFQNLYVRNITFEALAIIDSVLICILSYKCLKMHIVLKKEAVSRTH